MYKQSKYSQKPFFTTELMTSVQMQNLDAQKNELILIMKRYFEQKIDRPATIDQLNALQNKLGS
jgi:hypothetical protein